MNTQPDIASGESAQAAQDAIAEEFAFFGDWTERYQYLIDLGGGDAQRLTFQAISDSAIVSGLIALLLRVYSGRSAQEILATEPRYITAIGLAQHLSPTRSNGLAAMLAKIKDYAQRRSDAGGENVCNIFCSSFRGRRRRNPESNDFFRIGICANEQQSHWIPDRARCAGLSGMTSNEISRPSAFDDAPSAPAHRDSTWRSGALRGVPGRFPRRFPRRSRNGLPRCA